MSDVLSALLRLTPEEVASLPPTEREWVTATLERELILRSPADFATRLSGGAFVPYRHAVHTSEAIRSMIEDDDCDLLLVEQSVRHGKTLLCSRWTPAWFVAKFRKRALLSSYEADFAATHGRAAREILKEHGSRFGIEIDESSRAANRWQIVGPEEAGMGTAGAGGPITGKGGHLLIVDDPIKNFEEANSATMREHLWDWWQNVWVTRQEPGAKFLVIMSRWHSDDLVGRLLEHEGSMRIKRLRMPAIAEDEDDLLGRRPGEALCPERYDEEALAGIRKDVGPTSWASLYQQRPVPRGGGMFKRDSFRYFTRSTIGDETYYQLGDHTVAESDCVRFSTMDVAYTRTQRSDFTVCATFALAPTDPQSLLLLDVRRKRVTHADHAPLVEQVWAEMHPSWVGIEKQSATLSLFDEMQRRGVVVRWLVPDKNKVARAETAVSMLEAGRLWFPRDAAFLDDLTDELVMFPASKHDDQVDVIAYACGELARRTIHARRRKEEPTTRAEQMWERLRERDRQTKHHPVLGRF